MDLMIVKLITKSVIVMYVSIEYLRPSTVNFVLFDDLHVRQVLAIAVSFAIAVGAAAVTSPFTVGVRRRARIDL